MFSKSTLKLIVLVLSLTAYVVVIRNIPGIKEAQPINFGWLAIIALAAVYLGLRWAGRKIARSLLVRVNTNFKHPLIVAGASALGVLLLIPATALVTLAIPGVAFYHPGINALVVLALSVYFAVVDGAWAFIDGDYKNNDNG